MKEKIIYEIPIHDLRKLYYKWKYERSISRSLFLTKNLYEKYIAIDNECNCFAINEFDSYDKALFWLCSKHIAPFEVDKLDKEVIDIFNKHCNCKLCKYGSLNELLF